MSQWAPLSGHWCGCTPQFWPPSVACPPCKAWQGKIILHITQRIWQTLPCYPRFFPEGHDAWHLLLRNLYLPSAIRVLLDAAYTEIGKSRSILLNFFPGWNGIFFITAPCASNRYIYMLAGHPIKLRQMYKKIVHSCRLMGHTFESSRLTCPHAKIQMNPASSSSK